VIFISYAELARDIVTWSENLPRDLDLIVGVTRSGMIPASMLALHRNVRLTSVESFYKGQIFEGGFRDQHKRLQKVLVVDDSLLSGRSIQEAAKLLKNRPEKIFYGAVYVKPGMQKMVHHYAKTLALPRIFEWNWSHHFWLKATCMDIDGVLCRDPTREENDDGPKYGTFLRTVSPCHIPTVQVNTLVTSRLERYRVDTVTWLEKNGVSYKQLIMHPAATAKERRVAGDHAIRKAAVFRSSSYKLFIESSERQAKQISELTKKPVLCTDRMCLASSL